MFARNEGASPVAQSLLGARSMNRLTLISLAFLSFPLVHCATTTSADDDSNVAVDPSLAPAALLAGGATTSEPTTDSTERSKDGGTKSQDFMKVELDTIFVSSW
jgi:hypothetical protein